jgi:DNA invertase Pin-like site-specific DNA recombinase
MIVGYARTSTADQVAGLEAQSRDLEAAGATKIFSEHISATAKRSALEECLRFVREGDTLMVTKPDRLARSTADLLAIQTDLEKRGVDLVIQSMGLDTRGNGSNPTTRLQLTILAAVAQFERELMLERQKEGIAKAKAQGKYKGRTPTVERQRDRIIKLADQGIRPTEIARDLGVARSSVYRMLTNRVAIRGQLPAIVIKGAAQP